METNLTIPQPANLLSLAIEKGMTVEGLEKLMAMQERFEAKESRKLFYQALADFQSNCPVLKKSKTVSFNQTKYKYAPLSDVVTQIKDTLSKYGLSFRWEIKDEGQLLSVTCIITHRDGHFESTSMSASADTSGAKNAIQARGSAISYLQRYTLIGSLGISSADEDTDGKATQKDIEGLHKEYMDLLNPLIQDNKKWMQYHPDNWKKERTPETYVAAIKGLKEKMQ